MTELERHHLKRERADLKAALFGWIYGGIPQSEWPPRVLEQQRRAEEIDRFLAENPPVQGPISTPIVTKKVPRTVSGRLASRHQPANLPKIKTKAAADIIAAARSKYGKELSALNIDFSRLELLVIARKMSEEDLDDYVKTTFLGEKE